MPKIEWCKRLTPGIIWLTIVPVAVGGVLFWYATSQEAMYEQEADGRIADYSRHAFKQIYVACDDVLPSAKRASCINKAAIDYELKVLESKRSENDLIAQRRSVLWSSIMGIAAIIGMVLSAIGVILLRDTFRETRKAADAAMQSHIFISRPRFEFNAVHLTVERGRPIAGKVLVENVGNTVATISYGSIGFLVCHDLPVKNPIDDFACYNRATWTEFTPQPRWWDVEWSALSNWDFDDMKSGKSTLYLIGRLVYGYEGMKEKPENHAIFAFSYCPKSGRCSPVSDPHYFRVGALG